MSHPRVDVMQRGTDAKRGVLVLPEDHVRETDRLILTPATEAFIPAMFDLARGRIDTRWLTWDPHPDISVTRAFVDHLRRDWESGSQYLFLLIRRADAHLLGWCGLDSIDRERLRAHLGYCLAREYEGRGYMSEAVASVLDLALRVLGLEEIYTSVWEGNQRSVRVLERAGFRHLGRAEEPAMKGGQLHRVDDFLFRTQVTKEENP